ncbi:MAG: DUF1553 domain-containing protein, partial [Pedosphaera sp.]|nr:DUF1553 domain-containing protein [Pedosphaera sp.]
TRVRPEGYNNPNIEGYCSRQSVKAGVTTTATQSLLLLNSEWTRKRAAALAKRLAKRHPGNAEAQITDAHELAFGQAPLPSQLNDALAFLDTCGAANKPSGLAALTEYCHVLMNANAFLYVD